MQQKNKQTTNRKMLDPNISIIKLNANKLNN